MVPQPLVLFAAPSIVLLPVMPADKRDSYLPLHGEQLIALGELNVWLV